MKNFVGVFVVTILSLFSLNSLVVNEVQASPINYTFTGTGSGTEGTTSFNNAAFIVSINADTDNIAFQGMLGSIGALNLSGTIDISGIGIADFTSPLFIYGPSTNFNTLGFGNNLQGNSIGFLSSALHGYDLKSSFSLLPSPNAYLVQFHNVGTDLGTLSYSQMSDVAFVATATPVPEPSTILLFGAGIGGFAIWRRKKQGKYCQTRHGDTDEFIFQS